MTSLWLQHTILHIHFISYSVCVFWVRRQGLGWLSWGGRQCLMFISKALFQTLPSYHSIIFMFRNNKYLANSWDCMFWEISPMQNLIDSLNECFHFVFLLFVFKCNIIDLFAWLSVYIFMCYSINRTYS